MVIYWGLPVFAIAIFFTEVDIHQSYYFQIAGKKEKYYAPLRNRLSSFSNCLVWCPLWHWWKVTLWSVLIFMALCEGKESWSKIISTVVVSLSEEPSCRSQLWPLNNDYWRKNVIIVNWARYIGTSFLYQGSW